LKIDKIIPEKMALKITLQVAEALRYAWDEFKILHRDIKPANIMLDKKGSAKLMDMGISKSISEDHNLTMTGMIVGTPYYMSPEQALSKPNLDFRADLYSLGATLYHMVTGSVPYDADTAVGILTKHITDPLPMPREVNPELSQECEDLLEIMLAKNKGDRQNSWEEAISDIKNVISGKSPETPTPDMAAAFTETRTFDRSASYEDRIKKFKKYKPKILDYAEDHSKKSNVSRPPGYNDTKELKRVDPAFLKKMKKDSKDDKEPENENGGKKIILIACAVIVALILLIVVGLVLMSYIEKVKQDLSTGIEVERVISKLKKSSDKLAAEKQFEKAAENLMNYSGPYQEETADKRKELADEYMEKKKAVLENENSDPKKESL
jgi:serine/threonine protein kinase